MRRIRADDISVHVVEIDDEEFIAWLKHQQFNVIATTRFHPLVPNCNKLQQLRTFQHTDYDRVVLMDCDTAWVGDLELPDAPPICASIDNYPNPPEPILARIFAGAGDAAPEWVAAAFPLGEHRLTDRNNCKGGRIYICERTFLTELEDAWRSRALWSLAHFHLFDEICLVIA